MRTLIMIQITPSSVDNFKRGSRKSRKLRQSGELEDFESGKEGDGEYVQNAFMMEMSNDPFNTREKQSHDEFYFQERVEEIDLKSTKKGAEIEEEKAIFTVILYHGHYPYDAPYITVSLKNHFPRVDDFRNYFYDIMDIDRWWPLITLKEIIQRMPYFAFQLIKLTKSHSIPYYGQFQYEIPMYKEDLLELCPFFCVFKLLLKESYKNLINSYKETQLLKRFRYFYFTYSEIVVLSQKEDSYTMERMFLLEQLSQIQGCEDKDNYKIKLKLKEGRTYKIKWNMKDINEKHMRKLLIFESYYRSAIEELQPPKEYSQRLQAIELYNQIIIQAYELSQHYIAEWAKKKIVDLA